MFSLSRTINHFLIVFQNKILKNDFVIGYPQYVVVDTTNICTLHCPLCPTGQGRKEYPIGVMKFTTFKKIVDELGKWLYDICIGDWGEPLLNPEIAEMTHYAHKHNIRVSIFTNLNTLDENMADRLVKSKLERLCVSIDGITQESYEKYRRGGKLNKVFANIELILQAKRKYKSDIPVIYWQFLTMKHNEGEVEDARNMANKIGVKFRLEQVRCDVGRELFMSDKEKFKNVMPWLPANEQYSRYNYETGERKRQKKLCNLLWRFTAINWDGGIAPCCAVYEKKYNFGNIETQEFKTIWNNVKYRTSRKIVSKKRVGKDVTICANCLKNGFID